MQIVAIIYFTFFSFIASQTQAFYGNYDGNKERVVSFANQWAPKIWLHPQEKFFPLHVSRFLSEVTIVESKNCSNCALKSDFSPKKTGATGQFLVTKQNRDCLLQDESSFMFGVVPSEANPVPVYAFVTVCDPAYKHFSITYWFFYAFNEGKNICTLRLGKSDSSVVPVFKLFDKCLGKTVRYGNHVGDWERMTLDVKNWTASSLFLSVHNVGVYYEYNKASHSFILSSTPSRGVSQVQEPPSTVHLIDNHPLLFSARGSHALWAASGSYLYTKLKLSQLVDEVERGSPWETWRALQLFINHEWTPAWYNFGGKWGNPRSGCLGNSDLCFFSDGPDGLSNRPKDFRCG